MRPESGGLLLSACDEEMVPAGSPQVAPGATMHLAEKVTRTFPTLGQVGVRRSWAGLRTFAPDREFVVGYDDDRLFWVAGLGGHGVTTCVAVGRLAARAIAGEVEPPAALLPTSPAPGARDGHWQPPSFAGRETA